MGKAHNLFSGCQLQERSFHSLALSFHAGSNHMMVICILGSNGRVAHCPLRFCHFWLGLLSWQWILAGTNCWEAGCHFWLWPSGKALLLGKDVFSGHWAARETRSNFWLCVSRFFSFTWEWIAFLHWQYGGRIPILALSFRMVYSLPNN